jgi:hypothetical protein
MDHGDDVCWGSFVGARWNLTTIPTVEIYGEGVFFFARTLIVTGKAVNRNTTIRVRAGTKNSRPVGFLL